MTIPERRTAVAARFEQRYGRLPALWSRAPGRVDLMGSHTDYNMGFVMTMTIDRDSWIAAAPREDGQVTVSSMNAEGGGSFSLAQITRDQVWPWTNYIRGIASVLRSEGLPLRGWDGLIHSTVPFGSGLSSSAAVEMAAAIIFQQVSGFSLDPVRMALLAQRAENRFVGVNCGVLDQYSSAMGQEGCALLLDCRDLTSRAVPIAAGIQVVICDTRAARHLAGTEYGERRAQCEEGVRIFRELGYEIAALRDLNLETFTRHESSLPGVVARRCRFIIEENQRVLDLAGALDLGDRPALRRLFAASFAGARALYEISAPAMEAMMEAMLSAPGVIGARQAGAGFGGCMVALVEQEQLASFTGAVCEAYAASTGIEPSVFPVSPSAGAGVLGTPSAP